jgi:hypothetical protein
MTEVIDDETNEQGNPAEAGQTQPAPTKDDDNKTSPKEPAPKEPAQATKEPVSATKDNDDDYVLDEKELEGTVLDNDNWKEILKANKVTGKQAVNLLQSLDREQDQYYTKDDLDNEFKSRFGNGYKNVFNNFQVDVGKYADPKDIELLEKLPNKYVGVLATFVENLKKDYGVSNTTKIDGGLRQPVNPKTEFEDNFKKLMDNNTPISERKVLIQRNTELSNKFKF